VYLQEVREKFTGEKFSVNPFPLSLGITRVHLECFNNTGIGCLALAIQGGATRIIMLGYDCQKTGGKTHWHGDHPKMLGNAVGVNSWPDTFAMFADKVETEIVNASRETAIYCFPRMSLEEALKS
jgi:hypothetical protein